MTDEHDARIRQLECDHASALARIASVEDQQRAAWAELRRISKEGREEFAALRADQRADTEKIMTAINANKIAWSMMNSGTKIVAWIILALSSIAGAISAVVLMIKRLIG